MAEESKDVCGYDEGLFVNQHNCKRYECGICLCVIHIPMDIHCTESHHFCQQCILKLPKNYNNTVTCPICRQRVPFKRIKINKFVQRLMNDELIIKACKYNCGMNHIKLGKYIQHLKHGCPNEYIQCKYKCNNNIMRKDIIKHEQVCPLKEFFEKDLSPFIVANKTNMEIAQNIKKSYENIYGKNIIVFVSDINTETDPNYIYYLMYTKPFQRQVTNLKSKNIDIYKIKCSMINTDKPPKPKIMKNDYFSSFVKGLVMDKYINNENNLSLIRKILTDVFGGAYLIAKNYNGIACDCFDDHHCKFTINNDEYQSIKIK